MIGNGSYQAGKAADDGCFDRARKWYALLIIIARNNRVSDNRASLLLEQNHRTA